MPAPLKSRLYGRQWQLMSGEQRWLGLAGRRRARVHRCSLFPILLQLWDCGMKRGAPFVFLPITLVVAFGFELLNFTNFCYRDMRYYDPGELVDIAIKLNLARFDPNGERNKPYESIETFRVENPNCCKLLYSDEMMGVSPMARLFGTNEVVARVYYKMSDTADEYQYYDSLVKMNSCGDVLRRMGTPEQYGPA
jgi:hypothetical protein